MKYILALDEGTTSARSILFDRQARPAAADQIPIECEYPRDGWVQQDAERIWQAQETSIRRAVEKAGATFADIAAIGITNQRETTVVWERATGEPVGPAVVWQCRRTGAVCRRLIEAGAGKAVTRATGLVIDPYFSATKISWILDHIPDGRRRGEDGELLFGTVDSWLIWKLTKGRKHVIDVTNASRTLLLNLAQSDWDVQMLDLFGVPRPMLPEIVPSCGVVAQTDPSHFGREIPIAGVAGDQHAALFGQTCFRPGLSKNTYGTGCFLLMHTGEHMAKSRNGMLSTTAANETPGELGQRYALEGSIFIAGAVVQWLRDNLELIQTAAESAAVAESVPDSAGVYLVPAFVGLGAPHWDSHARGVITGLTRAAGAAHLVRAGLESIAYQTRELVDAMEKDADDTIEELRADGGAAANDFLLQFQADILGKPVVRPKNLETTALGAAFLAGQAAGFWKGTAELEQFWEVERRFEPEMTDARREELYAGWKEAIKKSRTN